MPNLLRTIAALAFFAMLAPAAHAASSAKAITLANTGNGPLTISGAKITGNTSEFTLTPGGCSSPVPVGGSCSLNVTYTPGGSGPSPSATLVYSSNGTNGPTHSIPLSGTGAASGHSYWRVLYTATSLNPAWNSEAYSAAGEVVFRATAGGANLASGGTALSSSNMTWWGRTFYPSLAFDGVAGQDNGWSSTSYIGAWVGYQFSTPVAVKQLVFTAFYYTGNYGTVHDSFPPALAVEFSDNGTTWTRVREFTGLSWTRGSSKTFDF